jgi:uroporphyrinogen decarboxylase
MTAAAQPSHKRLLRVLNGEILAEPPIWLMRQAGRYLPEYRELRQRVPGFLDLCFTPELATEATLQPVQRFAVDAAILFSDILVVAHGLGQTVQFHDGEGPVLDAIRSAAATRRLSLDGFADRVGAVYETVAHVAKRLPAECALIGFAGAPWTLATYMVEGGSSKDFGRIKKLLYADPHTLHKLLDVLAHSVTQYLNAQVAAGAQALMIFDTWGGALTPPAYREFSLQYMSAIAHGLKRESEGRRVPVVMFTKSGGPWLEHMAEAGADALGIDWTQDLADARQRVGAKVALQGNLDPTALYASPETVRDLVWKTLAAFGHHEGHVFNLGHGIHADTPPENVAAMVQAVHDLSPAYHK